MFREDAIGSGGVVVHEARDGPRRPVPSAIIRGNVTVEDQGERDVRFRATTAVGTFDAPWLPEVRSVVDGWRTVGGRGGLR